MKVELVKFANAKPCRYGVQVWRSDSDWHVQTLPVAETLKNGAPCVYGYEGPPCEVVCGCNEGRAFKHFNGNYGWNVPTTPVPDRVQRAFDIVRDYEIWRETEYQRYLEEEMKALE